MINDGIIINKLRQMLRFAKAKRLRKSGRIFRIQILLGIFVGIGCHSLQSVSLPGLYESRRSFERGSNYAIGETLTLNPDSSYEYKSCGGIEKGFWKLNTSRDSLLMFCKNFRYINDSLNRARNTTCYSSVPGYIYKIEPTGNLLLKYSKFYIYFVKAKS